MLACFGDVGGVYGFIVPLLALIICPMAEHSFFLKAAGDLYFAKHDTDKCRTKTRLFPKSCGEQTNIRTFLDSGLFNQYQVAEIEKHWPIFVNSAQSVSLYFARFAESFSCLKRFVSHKDEKL